MLTWSICDIHKYCSTGRSVDILCQSSAMTLNSSPTVSTNSRRLPTVRIALPVVSSNTKVNEALFPILTRMTMCVGISNDWRETEMYVCMYEKYSFGTNLHQGWYGMYVYSDFRCLHMYVCIICMFNHRAA